MSACFSFFGLEFYLDRGGLPIVIESYDYSSGAACLLKIFFVDGPSRFDSIFDSNRYGFRPCESKIAFCNVSDS